jgi:hypothetical protein
LQGTLEHLSLSKAFISPLKIHVLARTSS